MLNTLKAYIYAIRQWHNKILKDYEDEKLSKLPECYELIPDWESVQEVPDDKTKGTPNTEEEYFKNKKTFTLPKM